MLPWERDVYVGLLVKHIKEEKEKARRESAGKGSPNVPKGMM
tara:strand:- start:440 stop:565 length:126 start_codon:yes stop_codon:yes gene_type:complete